MKKAFSAALALFSVLATFSPGVAFALDPTGMRLAPTEGFSVAPLPEELFTQEEADFYNTRLQGASAEVKLRFRYTRSFYRYCRRVADSTVPQELRVSPIDLPDLPDERKWDRAYLFRNEARDVVDVALGRKMVAQMQGQRPSGRPIPV